MQNRNIGSISSESRSGGNISSEETPRKVSDITKVADTVTQTTRASEYGLRTIAHGIYMDMITVSHAETMDAVFPQWLRLAYRGGGENYTPYNLNMPATLPRRPIAHFSVDSPITEHGMTTAGIVGIGLKKAEYVPFSIYSSPELRCVQTAASIANRLESTFTSICVEPALADWVMWQEPGIPDVWIKPKQLSYLGYPIDLSYVPFLQSLPLEESVVDYQKRLTEFYIHARNQGEDRVLMIVANPAAVVLSREGKWDNVDQLKRLVEDISPCTVHALRVGNKQMLHNESDKAIVHHFTRTVTDRINKEKRTSAK